LRSQIRTEIKKLHQTIGTTIIYVTRDQVEAMTLADRIVILRGGVTEQVFAHRSCSCEFGYSSQRLAPHRPQFVEKARVDAARAMLEGTRKPLKLDGER